MSRINLVALLLVVANLLSFRLQSSCLGDELDLAAIARMHLKEAEAYRIYLDPGRNQPLELQADPIFKWQNLTNQGGQLGAIYVWSQRGRPEVIGTIFSQPEGGRRNVIHEFHTLAVKELTVDSPEDCARKWKPKGVFSMQPLIAAPPVAETALRRNTQMRNLSKEFKAFTQKESERVELRLAPQPVIRYQPNSPDVLDGAIFAFLSSAAGTDPEMMVMIEARKVAPNDRNWSWHMGIIRFTDRDLVVSRNDSDVFSSINNAKLRVKIEDSYRWIHNSDETYCVFQAKFVPELTKSP